MNKRFPAELQNKTGDQKAETAELYYVSVVELDMLTILCMRPGQFNETQLNTFITVFKNAATKYKYDSGKRRYEV